MKTTQLVVSDPQYLAEFIGADEIKTFFEARFEVPPDHLGLLMRNGQFVQAYKGAHFSVGGLFHQLKGLIGGLPAIRLFDGAPPATSIINRVARSRPGSMKAGSTPRSKR